MAISETEETIDAEAAYPFQIVDLLGIVMLAAIVFSVIHRQFLMPSARRFYRETGNINALKVWRIIKHGLVPSEQLLADFNRDFDGYYDTPSDSMGGRFWKWVKHVRSR